MALEVISGGRQGAFFSLNYFELVILLLADDAAFLSETVVGLQTELNSLSRAVPSLQLSVNLNKVIVLYLDKEAV